MKQTNEKATSLSFDLVVMDEVDSTNDELRRILEKSSQGNAHEVGDGTPQGQSPAKALLAMKQTSGRGRLGRSWTSPPGSIYLSLAVDTTKAGPREAALSLVVALAIRNTLSGLLQPSSQQPASEPAEAPADKLTEESIQVKWPNDVICNQGKLVGILVESVQLAPKQRTAIIGAGINIIRPNSGANEAAAYLSDLCMQNVSLQKIAEQVIEAILSYVERWQAADFEFSLFKEEYNDTLALAGKSIVVGDANANKVAEGVVLGIDESGYLLLEAEEKGSKHVVRISGGEVTLRVPDC